MGGKASPTVAHYSTWPCRPLRGSDLDRRRIHLEQPDDTVPRWNTRAFRPVRRLTWTRRPRRRCIRWPGRRCSRRSPTAGPTRRGSMPRAGGPSSLPTRPRRVRRGPGRTPGRSVASGPPARPPRRPRCSADWPAGRRQGGTLVHSAIEHSGGAARGRARRRGRGRGRRGPAGPARPGRLGPRVSAPGVALAALISASHEVGTVQPVAAAADYCAEAGVPLFVDAAQSVGRVPVPPGWSLLSASAHKWGGPPGVGVLVVRKGVRWLSPYPQDDLYRPGVTGRARPAGGGRRRGEPARRAGRGAGRGGAAGRAGGPDPGAGGGRPCRTSRWSATRSSGCRTWSPSPASTWTARRCCTRWTGRGSRCPRARRARRPRCGPSHVLEAMGVLSHGNVRVSLHRDTTAADVDRFLAVLPGHRRGDPEGGRALIDRGDWPAGLPRAALPAAGDRAGQADPRCRGRRHGAGARRRPGGGQRHPGLVPDEGARSSSAPPPPDAFDVRRLS